jgi:hypothetical protein
LGQVASASFCFVVLEQSELPFPTIISFCFSWLIFIASPSCYAFPVAMSRAAHPLSAVVAVGKGAGNSSTSASVLVESSPLPKHCPESC